VGDTPVVSELMRTAVVSVEPERPVADAAAHMAERKVGSACVLQGSFLVGILTERDVLRAAGSGADLTVSQVREWMTGDPHWATPGMSTEEAAQIMFRGGFRHLPVVDGRHVCGIVSLRDLFAARIRRPAQA
jgi:CBS domain-containing protein